MAEDRARTVSFSSGTKKRPFDGRFLPFDPFLVPEALEERPVCLDRLNARRCIENRDAHMLYTISKKSAARLAFGTVSSFVLQTFQPILSLKVSTSIVQFPPRLHGKIPENKL
jgi:hypothetical protein